MSLEFVSGALFALGLLLISSWLRDRWRYRVGYRRPPPAVRPRTCSRTDDGRLMGRARP